MDMTTSDEINFEVIKNDASCSAEAIMDENPMKQEVDAAHNDENPMKQEVVAAYNEVLNKLKVMKRVSKEEKQEKEKLESERAMVQTFEQETSQDFVKKLNGLKQFVGKYLDEIRSKLLPEYEKFHTLRQAIIFSEKELEELYTIKVNVNTLSTLLFAQKEKAAIFEKEMQERRINFENEMADHERRREHEENEFQIQREATRKKEQEQYEIKKQEMEQELREHRAKFEEEASWRETNIEARETLVSAREAEYQNLKNREAMIVAREQEYQQLKEDAARFPEEMRSAVQRAEQSVTDQLTRKYEYDIRLLKIELESERKLYLQKTSALEEQIDQYKSLKQHYDHPYVSASEETQNSE